MTRLTSDIDSVSNGIAKTDPFVLFIYWYN